MSYFSEFPENQYLMLCLCAHCDSFMLVHLERDNIHKFSCRKCKKDNKCLDIQRDREGSLECTTLKFNYDY